MCVLDMSQKQAKGRKNGGENFLEINGKGSRKCGWSVEVMNLMYGCQLKHQMDGVVKMMSSGVEKGPAEY